MIKETPLYMMWLRQLKRYFRSKPRIMGSLGQPLLFLLSFGLGFGPVFQKAGEGNYIQFLSPGIISMSVLFTAMFSGIEIIWDRQFGFLKETLVAPVSRAELLIGKTLGGATTSLFQGIMVFILAFLVGFRPENWAGISMALLFVLLVSFLFTGIGTIIGSFLDDMHAFPVIMNFLVMPLFFLSGAIFPLKDVPSEMLLVAKFNPLSYGVDGIRASLMGGSLFSFQTDIIVLSASIIFVFSLGAYFFSRLEA